MLSILIPVYNYNIAALVTDLFNLAVASKIDFEIIVIEDGSQNFLKENSSILNIKYTQYIALSKNIGRAAIRNKLADSANGDFLLFLDCDTEIFSESFLKDYLPFCTENSIVAGGIVYKSNTSSKYSLAVKYGQDRERFTEKNKKNKKKYPVLTTPNFLIDKNIFKTVRFNEDFKEYGHEDTIFGIDLQAAGFKLNFINNPVYHIGLNENFVYIKNNEIALNTLLSLYYSEKYPQLTKVSKILKFFKKIKTLHLQNLLLLIFKIFKKLLIKNISSKSPSLLCFDFYKIGYFCQINKIYKLKRKKEALNKKGEK